LVLERGRRVNGAKLGSDRRPMKKVTMPAASQGKKRQAKRKSGRTFQ
tara:strand:- start:969 stop:1109 length:141 start_codon:yes stop_codon:yes gene_type:complete